MLEKKRKKKEHKVTWAAFIKPLFAIETLLTQYIKRHDSHGHLVCFNILIRLEKMFVSMIPYDEQSKIYGIAVLVYYIESL